MRETENLIFFIERSIFVQLMSTKNAVFPLVAPPLVKILLFVLIRRNKTRSYTINVKYPLSHKNCCEYIERNGIITFEYDIFKGENLCHDHLLSKENNLGPGDKIKYIWGL